jgi:hypothetical protein
MGVNARRVLERIEIEHMEHGGVENGALPVTHKDFMAAGVKASEITPAIKKLVFLGIIHHERGGRYGGTNKPSKFGLAWLPDQSGSPATNRWKAITAEQIEIWKGERSKARKGRRVYLRNQKATTDSRGMKPRLSVVVGGKKAGG